MRKQLVWAARARLPIVASAAAMVVAPMAAAIAPASKATALGSAAVSPVAVPPRDTFKGTVTGATGRYAGDRARVSIAIRTPAPGPTTRHATFRLSGPRCRGAAHCVRLVGRLHGTITVTGPYNPDVGKDFTISGSGTVKPLGHVAVTGTAAGTGFVAHGRESLQLTLTGGAGGVTLTAQSGLVAGFTSP